MGNKCCKPKEEKPTPQPEPEPEPTDPEYVKKLGEVYIVGVERGRGGFSIVKDGTHKKTAEKVAIKFINKKMLSQNDFILLQREMGTMKRVEHPNLLRLRETFDTDEELILVLDLVAGGELFYKIVERGNYSEKDAAQIMKQVIEGVEYLHSEGFAHRDLKPENLLCTVGPEKKDGRDFAPFRVVISDFGLSKNFETGQLTTSCGTPEYVAPEVITADGTYDKAVDMWSIGVITYVLLCGFSPFGGPSVDQEQYHATLFDKIIKAEYTFPDPEWTNISPQAKDFIKHLLVKDKDSRFTAQDAMKHDWLSGTYGTDAPLAGGDIARRITQYHLQRKEQLRN